jgi:hypothetical protein
MAALPFDVLLTELTPERPKSSTRFNELERSIERAERWADRVPALQRSCLYVTLSRYAVFRRGGHEPVFVLALDPAGPDRDGHA